MTPARETLWFLPVTGQIHSLVASTGFQAIGVFATSSRSHELLAEYAHVSFFQQYNNEIVTAVISLVTGIVLTIIAPALVRRLSSVVRWTARRIGSERSLAREYRKNLAFEVRQLKLLGMTKPRDLKDVFVPLRIREPGQPAISPGDVSLAYPTLTAALSGHQRVTVLGDPGAGKTSIARHATLLAAEGRIKINGKALTPFYIALNEIKKEFESPDHKSEPVGSDPEGILAAAMEMYGFPGAQSFVGRRLRAGTCLVIFDGFDELASDSRQDTAAAMIRRLARNYHAENRIIVTSREAGFRTTLFNAFTTLVIEDLPAEQAHAYIMSWFAGDPGRGTDLIRILEESPRLQSLASNPLMLAVICITYDARGDLPHRRADLYEYCIDTLNILWDESRGVNREAAFSGPTKLTVLKQVAFELHAERKADCSAREFLAAVRKHLPEAGAKLYQDSEFVDEVIEHTGLIRQKGVDALAFQHLTFQEYLAARKLVDDGQSGLEYLADQAIDPWWSEPIVLAAGILRNATALIEGIYQKVSPNLTDETCLLLGKCITDADLSDFALKDEILERVIKLAYP